jgi:polysaccharide pyruvyl transferase WcaK-like protein
MKPIMYYYVDTSNRGDWVIKKSITEAIQERIDIPFAFMSAKNDELTEQRILKQLNTNCSALMIAGSGLYTNYSKSSGWYFPCKTELFEKIKVPIILIGIGNNQNLKGSILNSELKEETKKSIKLINDLAVISTVRDKRTYNLLKNLGINKHQLMLDPANFLKVRLVPKKRKVAIQIAQHAPVLGRFDGTTELRTYNVNTFAKIATNLIEQDYEVVFIAHDALEHSLIEDLQKINPKIQGLNTDDLDLMLKTYAECRFVIAMKMHSCIMSFASGTPFINVYYDCKSTEYLKMLNAEELGVNVFTDYYKDLNEKVNLMLNEYRYYTQKIVTIKNKEQIKFDKLIGEICNAIQTTI